MIKKICTINNLNYKKEISILIIPNILFLLFLIIIIFLLKQFIYVSLCFYFDLLINALILYRLMFINDNRLKEENNNLIKMFYRIYLELNSGKNIDDCLCSALEISSLKNSESLSSLIKQIKDENKKEYYLLFAYNFNNIHVVDLMLDLYYFKKRNDYKYIEEFNSNYLLLQNEINLKSYKDNKIKFEMINFLPLVATILIIVSIIISTIFLMNEYIYG